MLGLNTSRALVKDGILGSKLGDSIDGLVRIIQILTTGIAYPLVLKHLLSLDSKGKDRSSINDVLSKMYGRWSFLHLIGHRSMGLLKLSKSSLMVTTNCFEMGDGALSCKYGIL